MIFGNLLQKAGNLGAIMETANQLKEHAVPFRNQFFQLAEEGVIPAPIAEQARRIEDGIKAQVKGNPMEMMKDPQGIFAKIQPMREQINGLAQSGILPQNMVDRWTHINALIDKLQTMV